MKKRKLGVDWGRDHMHLLWSRPCVCACANVRICYAQPTHQLWLELESSSCPSKTTGFGRRTCAAHVHYTATGVNISHISWAELLVYVQIILIASVSLNTSVVLVGHFNFSFSSSISIKGPISFSFNSKFQPLRPCSFSFLCTIPATIEACAKY